MKNIILFIDSRVPYGRLDIEADHIINSGFEYHTYGKIPFCNKIVGIHDLSPDDNYIVRASTQIVESVFKENNSNFKLDFSENPAIYDKFKAGVFYSDGFNYLHILNAGLPLLNANVKIYNNLHLSGKTFDEDVFVKPLNDLKLYDAMVLPAHTKMIDAIQIDPAKFSYIDEYSLVAPLCDNIQRECRFFVVNGEVVSYSQYRLNKSANVAKINSKDDIVHVAKEYAKLYQPHDNFVFDIATLSNGDYKIIEYNCLNASGLYKSDSKIMFEKLFEYLEK